MFPPEVVENILLHCDGKTLMNAQHVDSAWKGCVAYISKETDIWKRCCHNDIPKYQLMQILTKHEKKVTVKMWRMIFYNWYYWQNISDNIDFEVEFFVITRTLCLNVFGEYISVGFENGFVHIYKADDMLRSFKSFRLMHLPVSSTAIIGEDDNSEPCQLLLNYNTALFVTDFNRKTYQPGVLDNCYKFGHYQKYVCCVTEYGKVTIASIKTDHIHEKLNFFPLTQVRIYSPAIVTDCFLTEYMCTILVNNKIQIIKYSQNSVQSSVIAVDQATLKFSCMDDANWQRVRCTTKFVSSQVLINLAKISDTRIASRVCSCTETHFSLALTAEICISMK
ncbi:PREDICTED: uncharacterized protein LOC108568029 [Nicrophorus vespilloides]|uniref:Uncharacterized protein LOC108568029 n=1 Tax=Nicrophorus vespilloides TaxID=110193 RepID=A0ABM1NC17_NICVS|nr:PREDICTED: uncharacterized protein LOC108568029 [Nicrophorus vespilloides]